MGTYRVTPLAPPVDLIAEAGAHGWLMMRDGIGVAGRGLHLRVPPERVGAELGAIQPGAGTPPEAPGPRAIGARPFRPDHPWDLVIPATQVIVDRYRNAWKVTIDTAEPLPLAIPNPAEHPAVSVEQVDDPQTWCASVADAVDEIVAGGLEKVVLSREVLVRSPEPLPVVRILNRLLHKNPSCFIFSVDGLVGASPELLVERDGEVVRSQPMAGTARRDPDPDADEKLIQALFASPDYRHEHQVTIDMVHDTLLEFVSYVDFEPEPSVVRLANVSHLASRVEGRLAEPAASVLELVDALHPTPAVSGRPLQEALDLIARLEPRDRGLYAGTVGWVDAAGNGTWAVSIRCAQIDRGDPGLARVNAGCGIVAGSDPKTELVESEAKLKAALAALLE